MQEQKLFSLANWNSNVVARTLSTRLVRLIASRFVSVVQIKDGGHIERGTLSQLTPIIKVSS